VSLRGSILSKASVSVVKRYLIAFILITFATMASALTAPKPPLLTNGGFEHGNWEWHSAWGHQGHQVVGTRAHSGEKCMYFSGPGAIKTLRYKYEDGPIEVTGWYKLQEVVPGDRPYWNWWLRVNFYDSEGAHIKHVSILNTEGTNDWRRFAYCLHSAPEGTRAIELVVSLHNCPGEAWVDDLQVRAAARPDVLADNNGSEWAQRKSVVHRKVSGGFRSPWGTQAIRHHRYRPAALRQDDSLTFTEPT